MNPPRSNTSMGFASPSKLRRSSVVLVSGADGGGGGAGSLGGSMSVVPGLAASVLALAGFGDGSASAGVAGTLTPPLALPGKPTSNGKLGGLIPIKFRRASTVMTEPSTSAAASPSSPPDVNRSGSNVLCRGGDRGKGGISRSLDIQTQEGGGVLQILSSRATPPTAASPSCPHCSRRLPLLLGSRVRVRVRAGGLTGEEQVPVHSCLHRGYL